ncbi:MAG: hypothetical protein ABSB59_06510 [Streptosporangiaceae bacterium]
MTDAVTRAPAPARSSQMVLSSRGLLAVMCACVVLVVGMVAAVNLAVPMLAASALRPSEPALRTRVLARGTYGVGPRSGGRE